MYSFLLIGQSNMAGRGFKEEVAPIENHRLHVLRNGRWQPMDHPVNHDRAFSGVCLAESFADACAKFYDTDIGLIPCADGGTLVSQWQPGEILYDHAVFQAKLAQRTSTIAGVLWHQGESDSRDEHWPHYEKRCVHVFESLKKDLQLSDAVPFLVGGLGEFLATNQELLANFPYMINSPKVDKALQTLANTNEYIGYVSAEGLTSNPDGLHFNAASLRTFGVRYFEKFRDMNTLMKVGQEIFFEDGLTELERI
ncbi:MAG: sialate O-acetylesterase [Clostridia bacterium]|nr:sialate O-acetylesterase [Clostridia bacterium]